MWGTRAQGASLAGLAAGASLIAGMALAQDPQNPFVVECNRTATPEDVETARNTHFGAKRLYEQADYADAVDLWRKVLKFDCSAIGTLLNLANAYERLGDRQNAVWALDAYILRAPEGTDVSKLQVRVENLKKALVQAQPPASASASAAPPPSASVVAPLPSATTAPPLVKPYGVAPWVTVGAGAVAMVAGGILIPVGRGMITSNNCTGGEESGQWQCTDLNAANQGQTMAIAGDIALGIGAATVVGGLVWEFVANKPAAAKTDQPTTGRRVHVSPSVGPGMTGATIHGTF
jgi:hypothetical protein